MRPRVLVLLAATPMLMGVQCGPTPQQTGLAVLTAAPAAQLVYLGAAWLLALGWRWEDPDRIIDWRPGLKLLVALIVLAAALSPIATSQDAWDWWGVAVASAGAVHVALALLIWRIWFTRRVPGLPSTSAFTGASAWAALVVYPAALPMLAGSKAPMLEPFVGLWLIGGFLGIPAGVLLLIFLAEARVRMMRARSFEDGYTEEPKR